jgi:hypothetical protein
MTREGAVAVLIVVVLVVFALIAAGWWRRTNRDAGLVAPFGEVPDGSAHIATFAGLYVATTAHDEPLERLAVRGLSFRSRADVTVTDSGLALDLTGQPRIYLAADRIASVGQATVAIDRVVEPEGLVRIAWHIDDSTVVDSYFRPQDASARALADAAAGILPSPQTGSDA